MASVWETRRNVAAGTRAAGRGSRRRARPPGPPAPRAPRHPCFPPRALASPAPQLAEPSRARSRPLSRFALLPIRSVPRSLFSNSNFSVFFLFSVLLIFLFAKPLCSSTPFFSFLFSSSLAPCLYLDLNTHPLAPLFVWDTLSVPLCVRFSVSWWLLVGVSGCGSPGLAHRDAAGFSSLLPVR